MVVMEITVLLQIACGGTNIRVGSGAGLGFYNSWAYVRNFKAY